jgi:hypothetical protein
MRGLELLRLPEAQADTDLDDLRVQIRKEWPELLPPTAWEWSDGPMVALDRRGLPLLYGPVERDPLRGARGAVVLPRDQLKRLKRIAELGVPFQRLAIVHELDLNGPIRDRLRELEKAPVPCSDAEARSLVGALPPHPGLTQAVRVFDAAVRAATAAAPIIRIALDPAIFGVIAPTPPRQGQLCLWYPLAAWRW